MRGYLRSRAVGDFICNLESVSGLQACPGGLLLRKTYHIDAAVARNSNDAVERAQVDAHNRHVGVVAG